MLPVLMSVLVLIVIAGLTYSFMQGRKEGIEANAQQAKLLNAGSRRISEIAGLLNEDPAKPALYQELATIAANYPELAKRVYELALPQ